MQDSKSTLFLVLEMAAGGELFDHIRADHEAATAAAAAMDGGSGGGSQSGGSSMNEASARHWMRQLLAGVAYCHECVVRRGA